MELERNSVQMEDVTSPLERATAEEQDRQFQRNLAWFQTHALEIYTVHRGKCVCIAGEQLFVANTPREALALATAAYPKDEGRFTRIIPRERIDRIYANQRHVVSL